MPQSPLEVQKLPNWIQNITLKNAVKQCLGEDFQCFTKIIMDNKTKNDNGSLMLKLTVQIDMKEDLKKSVSFILKALNENTELSKIYTNMQLLPKEEITYQKILPRFEQLYKDAGKYVKFAPCAYTVDANIEHEYVLLEDLSGRNYQHGNRTTGLDLVHMQQALIKLAELHAASACYVEHFGLYSEQFTQSIYKDSNKVWLKEFYSSKAFLSELKLMKVEKQLIDKLLDNENQLVERLLELQKVNTKEFNVLNHGDCWINNILFQHDAFGNIKDALLIDFQAGKYGSPAHDLYYLILSSAEAGIKLSQFDYMLRYYYDHLIQNLKLLQYHRPLPKLKNLHASLLNHGLIAYLVVSKVLPVVIADKTVEIFANQITNTNIYKNQKYVQSVEQILPWLDNRGGLDWM